MNRSEMKRTRKRPDLRGHFRVKIWIHVQEKSVQPRFQIRSVTIKSWKIRKLLGNHLRASKSNSLYPYIQFPVKRRILTITKMFENLTENRTICEKSLFPVSTKKWLFWPTTDNNLYPFEIVFDWSSVEYRIFQGYPLFWPNWAFQGDLAESTFLAKNGRFRCESKIQFISAFDRVSVEYRILKGVHVCFNAVRTISKRERVNSW